MASGEPASNPLMQDHILKKGESRTGMVSEKTGDSGYTAIWEFLVDPAFEHGFVAAYRRNGTWAALMEQHDGYLGTELVRDLANPARFITIDHWKTEADWQEFRQRFSAQYEELDRQCAMMTVGEREIGRFAVVDRSDDVL